MKFLFLLGVVLCPGVLLAESERPNVVIIMTDEHHYGTLGCYGNSMFGGEGTLTPTLDRLAAEGSIATSFYASTPVCSPSRASFMSGKYPQKTGVVQNDMRLSGQLSTFADALKAKGYSTGFAGKWHLEGQGKPYWSPARNFGWEDNRYMFNRGHWKKLIETQSGPQVGARNRRGQYSYDLNNADEETFTTDWLMDRAIDFVQEHASEPFCYMVSIPDPHGPNTVREPYDTMYSAKDVVIPATLNRDNSQIPYWGQPDRGVTEQSLKSFMPRYFGMVKCIDDNIARLLKALEEKEVLENTIVIFTSDHGDLCGEHGKVDKGNPYEGSARVPFIVWNPQRVAAGKQIDVALTSTDFFPTLFGLLNYEMPNEVDGRDASELFASKQTDNEASETWTDWAVMRSTPGRQVWLAAVSDRYKIVYSNADRPWLFDLEEDPEETTNRFFDSQYSEVVYKMTDALKEYAISSRDPYYNISRIRQEITRATDRPEPMKLEIRLAETDRDTGLIPKSLPENSQERIYLHQQAVLTNEDLAEAKLTVEEFGPSIALTFTEQGASKMNEVTSANEGKRLAILIDDDVIVAPYIRSVIGKEAVITGKFSEERASAIVESLNIRR